MGISKRHPRKLFESAISSLMAAVLVVGMAPTSAFASLSSSTAADDAAIAEQYTQSDQSYADMSELSFMDIQEDEITPSRLMFLPESQLIEADVSGAAAVQQQDDALPTEVAGAKVESLKVSWKTPDEASDSSESVLTLAPTDDAKRSVLLSIEAALSGQYEYAAGAITFTIPKTFITDRDGNAVGSLKLSIPSQATSTSSLAWTDNGDGTVSIVNTKQMDPASRFLIQVEYVNIDPTVMNGAGIESPHFWCDLIVETGTNGAELIGMTNNELSVRFLTDAKVVRAVDTVQGFYEVWPTAWPSELKPADDGNYVYIDWYSYAQMEGNQYFDMSLDSSISGYKDGKILGVKTVDGTVHNGGNSDKMTVSLAKRDYRVSHGFYTHTYAAYPRNGLKNDVTSSFDHQATYTMTTADTGKSTSQTASANKQFTPKEWESPRGFFGGGKWRSGLYPISLNNLVAGTDQSFTYTVETIGFGAPFTTDKRYSDGEVIPQEELGKISYKLITDDNNTWFDNETAPLGSADFEFESLRVAKPVIYDYHLVDTDTHGWYTNSEGTIEEGTVRAGTYGYTSTDDPVNQPVVIIEGAVNGSSKYQQFGTIQWLPNGSTKTTAANGAKWVGTTIEFPANVTDTRQTAETKGHGCVYFVYPSVKIKANATNIAKVRKLFANSDDPSTYVRNEARFHALVQDNIKNASGSTTWGWKETNEVVMGADDNARGISYGVSLKATANVKAPGTSGNGYADRYIFDYTVQLTNQTNVYDTASYKDAVSKGYVTEETAGKWYCLLPPGVELYTLTSIGKRSGDRVNDYEIVENWRGTGRDMLIVDTSLTPRAGYYSGEGYMFGKSGYADKPYITFRGIMTSEDVIEYGCDTRLVAAYQSSTHTTMGNVDGFISEPDDPLAGNHSESKSAVGTYAPAMTSLSPSRDAALATVYAQDRSPVGVNLSGVAGLQKNVSIDGGKTFSRGTGTDELNIYAGDSYMYRLREIALTDEKNIVLYDELENTHSNVSGADASDATWRGNLVSVDTSKLVKAGIAPVVYYSTRTDLNLNDNAAQRRLSDSSVWTATPPADMSTVTAVAIDASKKTDGSDYVLPAGRSMTAYLNMACPSVAELVAKAKAAGDNVSASDFYDKTVDATTDAESGYKGGAHAINGVISTSTIVGGSNQKIATWYTKVGLRPFSIEIEKSWNDKDDYEKLRPASIDVDVLADGQLVRTVTLTNEGASGNTWKKAVIDDLPYKNASGEKIAYTFKERLDDASADQYTSTIKTSEKNSVLSVSIANSHSLTPVRVHLTKVWDDTYNGIENYGKGRPSSITVNICEDAPSLAAGRSIVKQVQLTADNNWQADVTLPQQSGGEPLKYSFYESSSGSRYSSSVTVNGKVVSTSPRFDWEPVVTTTDNLNLDVVITNKLYVSTTTYTFNKIWEDDYNRDKVRPSEVFIDVYANGELVEDASLRFTGGETESDWGTQTTRELPTFDENGNSIKYTFAERGENIFDASTPESERAGGYTSEFVASPWHARYWTVKNTHPILMANIPIVKMWDDNNNEAGARPESVTIDIYSNGKYLRQFVLAGSSEEDTWKDTIDLPMHATDGSLISYTFKESSEIPGYISTQPAGEDVPEFLNTYYPYGSLTIDKEIVAATDVSAQQEFEFRVTITDADGVPDGGTYDWERSDGKSGTVENGGIVRIQGGQSLTLPRIPSECNYEVYEKSATGWNPIIASYVKGQTKPGSAGTAHFANRYSATGTASFSAVKELTGKALPDGYFKFDVKQISDSGEETIISSGRNSANGDVWFAPVKYTLTDVGQTYHYRISEQNTGRTGYTYDERVYDAYVTVIDNGNGTLSADISYAFDGAAVDAPVFQNSYHAEGSIELVAYKELKGQDLSADQFKFRLVSKQTGEELCTAYNDADGNIVFGTLKYNESDIGKTYYYEASEIEGNDSTVVYTGDRYLFAVSVADWNGALNVRSKAYERAEESSASTVNLFDEEWKECSAPTFVNDSVPGELRIEKKVDGIAGQDYDPNAQFTFHVTLNTTGGFNVEKEEPTNAYAVWTPDDETMRFVRATDEDKARQKAVDARGGQSLPSDATVWTGFENTLEWDEWGNLAWKYAPWHPYGGGDYNMFSRLTTVDFVDTVAPDDMCTWFSQFDQLSEIKNIEKLDLSNCYRISAFVNSCQNLKELDASKMDVSNVKILESVFENSGIEYLDVSTWDFSNVETASGVFGGEKLHEVKVGEGFIHEIGDLVWNGSGSIAGSGLYQSKTTGKVYKGQDVTEDSYVFCGMPSGVADTYVNPEFYKLYAIYIADEETLYIDRLPAPLQAGKTYNDKTISEIIELGPYIYQSYDSVFPYSMRSKAKHIEIVDPVTTADSGEKLFYSFAKVEDIRNLDRLFLKGSSYGSPMTSLSKMFSSCPELKSVDLSWLPCEEGKWYTIGCLFEDDKKLETVILPEKFYVSTDGGDYNGVKTFYQCNSLVNIDTEAFYSRPSHMNYGEPYEDISYMFAACQSLKKISLPNLTHIASWDSAFAWCDELVELDMSTIQYWWGTYWGSERTSPPTDNPIYDDNKLGKVTVPACFKPLIAKRNYPWTEEYYLPAGTWVSASTGQKYTETTIPEGVADTYTREGYEPVSDDASAGSEMFQIPDFVNPPSSTANETDENGLTFEFPMYSALGVPIGSPFVAEQQRSYVIEGKPAEQHVLLFAPSVMAEQGMTFASSKNSIGSVYWEVTSAGQLTLTPVNGSYGEMGDWTNYWDGDSVPPWYAQRASIKSVKINGTVKASTMSRFLFGTKVTSMNLSGLDTSAVTNFRRAFFMNTSLVSVDLSSLDMSSATDLSYMFHYDYSLQSAYLPKSGMRSASNTSYMFAECSALQSFDMTGFSDAALTDTSHMFESCGAQYVTGMDSLNITSPCNMASMFHWSYITPAVLAGLDMSNVYNADSMFADTYNITEWNYIFPNLAEDANMEQMFSNWNIKTYDFSRSDKVFIDAFGYIPTYDERSIILGKNTKLAAHDSFYENPSQDMWVSKDSKTTRPLTLVELIEASQKDPASTAGTWRPAEYDTAVYAGAQGFDITLKPNEAYIIKDIPAGTTYSVSETITPPGWTEDTSARENTFGTILPGQSITATIKNVYTPNLTSAQLIAYKKLDGKPATELMDDGQGMFVFGLYEATYDASTNWTVVPGDKPIQTVRNNGLGEIKFEPIEFTEPTNKIYIVKEIGVADGVDASNYVLDDHWERFDVYVYQYSEGLYTSVSSSWPGAIFENTSVPGSLRIVKNTNIGTTQHFDFLVDYTTSDGEKHHETVQVGANQELVIEDLLAGSTYSVSETSMPAGWTQAKAEGAEGRIAAGEQSTASFANVYRTLPTSIILSSEKKMSDSSEVPDGKYLFSLYSVDKGSDTIAATASPISQSHANAGGFISFDSISYTEPGTYRYGIKEVSMGARIDNAINYDEHIEFVDVVVTDDQAGSLVADVRYDDDNSVFTNEIKSAKLVVAKETANVSEAFANRDYTFSVKFTGDDGQLAPNEIPYVIIDPDDIENMEETWGQGTVCGVDEISLKSGQQAIFDVPVGISYTVEESVPAGFACTVDEESGNIATGTMEADAVELGVLREFVNTYSASGAVKIQAHKTATDFDLKTGQFEFLLLDADGAVVSRASNNGFGDIEFKVAYMMEDAGKTFDYEIVEVNDNQEGIVYDSSAYQAKVDVVDNGDGTLSTYVKYALLDPSLIAEALDKATFDELVDHSVDEAVFNNIYSTSIALPLTGAQGYTLFVFVGIAALLVALWFVFVEERKREERRASRIVVPEDDIV